MTVNAEQQDFARFADPPLSAIDRKDAPVVGAPYAFVSYAHENWDSAVHLTEEFKLRGFSVFRDVESMREGRRIEHEMAAGIARADLLATYITEDSLHSEPVVEKEFKPALRAQTRTGRPIVMLIVCRLGATHEEVTANTWKVLEHEFSATWTGGIRATQPEPLPLDDAAALARAGLAAVYPAMSGPTDGAWQLHVATHGAPTSPVGLSVDATSFLGGDRRIAGHPASWRRVHQGLVDLEQVLRGHGLRRDIRVTGAAHITAGVATGFVFRRTAGWRLSVTTDDGECQAQERAHAHHGLVINQQPGALGSDFMTAEVNLFGRAMDGLVDTVLNAVGRPSMRLRVEHTGAPAYIPCDQLAAMATATALNIKRVIAERRAASVHLFLAAPLAFAVFLGAELNASGGFIQLYELADHAYHPSLELEGR